jgi:broad specificity phosphatase PhoE
VSGLSPVMAAFNSRAQEIYSWAELRDLWGRGLRFPAVTVDVMRHGETVNNAAGLVSGRADVALTDAGRAQAVDLAADLLPPYRAIFVSSMARSRETLAIALATRGIATSHVVDHRLNERGLGELEGRPRVFIHAFAGGDLEFAPPGGESYRSVARRCLSFLYDLYRVARVWRDGERVLICTHMGPMRVLTGIFHNEYSATRLLGSDWGNAMLSRHRLEKLKWPRFMLTSSGGLPLRKKVDE